MITLEEQIQEEMALAMERIVRVCKSAAITALEFSFTKIGNQPLKLPTVQPIQANQSTSKNRKQASPSRSREEIAALSAKFLAVVQENPGQQMSTLAPKLGLKPNQLRVPATRLKATKKIKTIGERSSTRYFPVLEENAA